MILRRVMVPVIGILLLSSFAIPLHVAAPDIYQPEVHDPIVIDGNEALLEVADSEGWLGTGSEESPIIIKGLNITSETVGIHIANVDLHFRIEECLIIASESTAYWSFGILIQNCENASIERCVIWNQEFGICLWNSDTAYVYRTEIFESFFGVFVNKSSGVWLHSLDIVVCKVGIRLNSSVYTHVDQTIIDHCEYSGIECIEDYGTMFRHNHIIGSEVGVAMAMNENWVIEESIIETCDIGIEAFHTTGGFVLRSMIKNCSLLGAKLGMSTSNVSLVENWFGPDNTQNAQDDGIENFWCEEYSQIGNYWSDYSGEGPYLIPGDAESLDLYPMSLEDAPKWEDVVTIEDGTTTGNDRTTEGTPPIGNTTLLVAAASVVVIVLVAVAMTRSRVS